MNIKIKISENNITASDTFKSIPLTLFQIIILYEKHTGAYPPKNTNYCLTQDNLINLKLSTKK